MAEAGGRRVGGALIVGGAGGLGAAIARRLAEDEVNVAITYSSRAEAAENVATELRAHGRKALSCRLDLRSQTDAAESVRKVVEVFGSLQTLVYAAGIPIPQKYVSEVPIDLWQQVVELDLFGFFRLVQASLPALRESRGSIVAITTTGTRRHPPRDILSTAPKASIEAVIKGVAREEGRFGVRANCVAPGMIDVGVGAYILHQEFTPAVVETMRRDIPMKHFGTPDDIAHAAVFLASDKAKWITGQILCVDGGWQI
jgi:NAD(P)-dependent dehydrogenase (short-subunit alcohol dehydrogenase family)